MTAIEMIAAERQRQIEREGWDESHDDDWYDGQLARAAAVYATPEDFQPVLYETPSRFPAIAPEIRQLWPWQPEDYKPTPNDRIRELVKAGALIVAEIERLQRMAPLERHDDQQSAEVGA